jgi:hypothetical protein
MYAVNVDPWKGIPSHANSILRLNNLIPYIDSPKSTMVETKSRRKKWNKKGMFKRVSAIRGKRMELKKAVKRYSVPKTTVRRFVHETTFSAELVVEK